MKIEKQYNLEKTWVKVTLDGYPEAVERVYKILEELSWESTH